jgi:HEAT repeat protein
VRRLLLATACLAAGMLASQGTIFAHGGQYRGPGDTVPPGGGGGGGGGAGVPGGPAGPSNPGGSGPPTPTGSGPLPPGVGPGIAGITPGGTDGADLTAWEFWWEFNKDPYLNLKVHLHRGEPETGSVGWFLGEGEHRQGKNTLAPDPATIRQVVVPALLHALETETDNDIVTGCLIALAKIGDAPSEGGESAFEPVILRFLADPSAEIQETAAVALGILANPRSIGTLEALARGTSVGRRLVGANEEVPYRTRAFAAYGLGLVGSRTGSEQERALVVKILREVIASDDTRSRDLQVASLIAMGLVPLSTIETPVGATSDLPPGAAAPAELSRVAQVEFLLAFLEDGGRHGLIRAHCPTALARLVNAEGLPTGRRGELRERIVDALLSRVEARRELVEIQQSCVLALGQLGTADDTALDRRVREALLGVSKSVKDQQTREFSMIALAQVGGSIGSTPPGPGIREAGDFLVRQLLDGKQTMRSWAGLSCGILAERLIARNLDDLVPADLGRAVRQALAEESNPADLGAYAIAAGIQRDVEAIPILLKRLERERDDTAVGYLAVALGLTGAGEAVPRIQALVEDSRYRPERLKQAAIALGLLGDKQAVPQLVELLREAKSSGAQAALASALGIIGDRRSIEPLVEMLRDEDLGDGARGFAAVALGIVADKEKWPWNAKIALDLNYRAAAPTLTDPGGTGILDIL